MKKIKIIFSSVFLFFTALTAFSLEVAVEEIEKASPVEFVNYTGPNPDPDNLQDIRNIGRNLAAMANFDSRAYSLNSKYSIMEVTNDQNDGLYSAAILSIDASARVDHIRNVRQIVAGYLEGEYGYSTQNANTLAFFLSFYNAVYRGNVAYLKTVYKPEVFNFVNETNAGIATNYTEWPGRTRFIIPLTPASSIEISALDGAVTAAARQNSPDRALNERESLTDMKEQTITNNEQTITDQQKALEENQQRLTEQQAAADQAAGEAQTAQQNAQSAQQNAQSAQQNAQSAQNQADQAKTLADQKQQEADAAKAAGDPAAAQKQAEADKAAADAAQKQTQADETQKQADEAQKQADETQKQADETQKQADETQKQANETQKQAQQQQNTIEKKQTENQKLQQQVAQEKKQAEQDKLTQEVRQNPEKAAEELANARDQLEGKSPFVGDKFYYMDVSGRFQNGHYKNKMLAIAPAEGTILSSSQDNICSKDFVAYGKGVVVVTATDANHASKHSLSLLNIDDLSPLATSDAAIDVYWSSFIYLDAGKIYAIVVGDDKQFYLGRFNEKMELEARSQAKLDGDTAITVNKDKIYVNLSGRKQIVVLNKNDLTTLSEIKLP